MVSTQTMVMWRGFFLFGALLVCQVLGANLGVAQSPRLATYWQGTYSYPSGDNRTPVPFTLQLSATGGSFTGRTTEPATFGNGSSSQLYATVYGIVSGNGISFTKTYDGAGGMNHSVIYRGSLSSDGLSMSGSWNIGNSSGSFRASAVAR